MSPRGGLVVPDGEQLAEAGGDAGIGAA